MTFMKEVQQRKENWNKYQYQKDKQKVSLRILKYISLNNPEREYRRLKTRMNLSERVRF